MVKTSFLVKAVERQAMEALRLLLEQVPTITFVGIEHEVRDHDRRADIVAHIELADTRHALFCEVKSSGQPRHVRMALIQRRNDIALAKAARRLAKAP